MCIFFKMLFILLEHDQDHVYHYSTFEGEGYGMFSTQENSSTGR